MLVLGDETMTTSNLPGSINATVVRFLGQRFGDGLVYMRDQSDEVPRDEAMRRGFLAEDGYVTAAGKHFWLSHS